MAVSLCQVADKHALIMAVATDDSKVKLYIENSKEIDFFYFIEAASLSGHEDWVRGLDFKVDVGKCKNFCICSTLP